MAKISSYPILSVPTLNDLLIGTDVENLKETKNFTISSILGLFSSQIFVPYTGAGNNVNIGIHSYIGQSFIANGGLSTQFLKADGSIDATSYQPAGNYITALTGEATATGPGSVAITLDNTAVISKLLTGLNITTGGSIVATDNILQAFGKVQNQINGLIGGIVFQGTWDAATNTPTLTSSVGVQGHYYIVSVAGNTDLNGITSWSVGDWVIFDGSAWSKVDNTDSVVSVNGYTGAVNLTYSDVGAPPDTRTLTINGTSYNLTADRSWTVGNVRTDSIYYDPTWIASLGWSKILSTPTTLAGYGITDGVPYTGASANVNLGEFGISAGYVGFDLTPTGTPLTAGTMSWDVDAETVDLVMNAAFSLKIGEDVVYYVKNQTGSTISKGTVVRADGTVGASGQIKIAPFIANGTTPSKYCMGVTSEAIANGANGFVMAFGKIRKINTSAFPNGTVLYASPTSAGGFTATVPTAPNNIVSVALVVYSDTVNGEIFVRPLFGSNINEDEGVAISSPVNNQVLTYNSTTGLWVNAFGGGLEQYASLAVFPAVGRATVTYLALDTRYIYYWNGTSYTEMAESPVVTITPGLNTSVTGSYPNFTIGLTDVNTNTTNLFNYYNFI
jgi:hypothetical protein